MSTRAVQCPECQTKLKVKSEITQFRCPKCQHFIELDGEIAADELFPPAEPRPAQPLPQKNGFPRLDVSGPPVDVRACIEPGTSLAVTLGYLGIGFGVIALAAATMGIGLLLALIAPVINYFNRKKALALVHGSGLKVGPVQFPELHDCVQTLWNRISNRDCPDVYIVEASVMNAFAVRLGKKNLVMLTDDMIHGCLQSSDPRTLAFVVGHELAHAALGHNSPIRTSMTSTIKKLSRLDEYTADRVAMRLIGEPDVATEGIVLLTVGPHLLPFINYDALEEQVAEVVADKNSRKAERHLTHPLLLHRLYRTLA